MFANILSAVKTIIVSAVLTVSSVVTPTLLPTPTPTPVFTDQNYHINGTYSYLGYKAEYSFVIPKSGGEFSGNISGVCNAPISGKYNSSSGDVSGNATGSCEVLFKKYQGTGSFFGQLNSQARTLTIAPQDLPIKDSITISY